MDKAEVLNSVEVTGRGYECVDKYPQLIKSVTVQDVINTANKYFSKPYVYAIIGPKDSINKI